MTRKSKRELERALEKMEARFTPPDTSDVDLEDGEKAALRAVLRYRREHDIDGVDDEADGLDHQVIRAAKGEIADDHVRTLEAMGL